MNFIPPGTTWLDIATLGIALVGVAIAVAGFGLAFWRYRRESKVAIRVEVDWFEQGDRGVIVVVMTNTERRVVTVERAGITATKDADGVVFEHWFSTNPIPKTLEAGSAPYGVLGSISTVKSAFYPAVPNWAFCVDIYRKTHWCRIPEDVQAAIRAAKRQIPGPDDEYGMPTTIDIDDD
jgi:hypothetical protein